MNAWPIYAVLFDQKYPTSYIMKDPWDLLNIIELKEVIRHKDDNPFIDRLNKIWNGDVHSNILKVLKPRLLNSDDDDYLEQILHILTDNRQVSAHDLIICSKSLADLVGI